MEKEQLENRVNLLENQVKELQKFIMTHWAPPGEVLKGSIFDFKEGMINPYTMKKFIR